MSFRIIKRLSIGSCIICSIIQQGWGKFHHLDGFTPKRRPCALQNIDRRKICTRINFKPLNFHAWRNEEANARSWENLFHRRDLQFYHLQLLTRADIWFQIQISRKDGLCWSSNAQRAYSVWDLYITAQMQWYTPSSPSESLESL